MNFNINKTQRVARVQLLYWQLVVLLFLYTLEDKEQQINTRWMKNSREEPLSYFNVLFINCKNKKLHTTTFINIIIFLN